MPRNLSHLPRFALLLVTPILLALLLPVHTPSFSQNETPVVIVHSFAELARQFAATLNKCGVKRIVILDFEDPRRQVTPFGAWLSDVFAGAPGNSWAPVEVVDRKQSAAKWEQLRIGEPYTIEPDRLLHLAKAFEARLVKGSYSPADNGLGLTLTISPPVSGQENFPAVKLVMTDEIKSHFKEPLESLVPSDGIFTTDAGGISIPHCVYCPNPTFSQEELNGQGQGTVNLMVVVDSKGHVGDTTVTRELTPELDRAAMESVKRWTFKPATDVDGKPVAVRVPVEIVFRLY